MKQEARSRKREAGSKEQEARESSCVVFLASCFLRPTSCFVFLFLILTIPHCAHTPRQAKSSSDSVTNISTKENSLYYYLISQLEGLKGREESSLFLLDRSIKKDPQSSFLLIEKAYHLARTHHLKEALEVGLKAFKEQPDDLEVNLLLGKIYSAKNESSQALIYFDRAIDLDPSNEEATTLKARIYLTEGETEKAIGALKNLIEKNAEAEAATFYLAGIYAYHKKDYPKALALYEDLLEISPDDPKVLHLIAELHLSQKDLKKAVKVLGRLAEQTPEDSALKTRMALLYYELQDLESAIKILEEIREVHPGAVKINYYLGLLYLEQGEKEKALMGLSQVPAHSDLFFDAVARQVVILKDSERIDQAVEVVRDALRHQPNHADFYDLLASLHLLQENSEKALSVLKRAHHRLGNHDRILFSLGVVSEKMGDWEQSIDYMKKVITLDPKNALALNFVGYTYAEHGQHLDEAQDLVEKALHLKPDDGYIVDSLGWVFYQKEDYPRSLELLGKANRLAPNEPTILEHLGEVYLKLHNKRQARRYFEKSLFELNRRKSGDKRLNEQAQRIREKVSGL